MLLNYEGTLMYKDTEIAKFKISGKGLEYCEVLCDDVGKYPGDMQLWGFDYDTFMGFFKTRVIGKHSMFASDYYNALGLKHYNAEAMLKLVNAKNNTDFFWVKEEKYGCKTWKEVRKLNKPVERDDIPEYLLL